jgi:fluoroacetyl-CoA thioesterase
MTCLQIGVSDTPYRCPDPYPLETDTPPGLEVTRTVELIAIEGKKLIFAVEAHDGVDLISKGRHERFVINKEKFDARVEAKALRPRGVA